VLFRRINRPHPEVTFDRLIEGLVSFREEFSGRLWIEVALVKGLNDTEEALEDIAAALDRIKPDRVHLNQPIRPPSEIWVEPTDEEGLLRARAILGEIAHVVHEVEEILDLSGFRDVVDAIISVVTRHPMSQAEIERALKERFSGEIDRALSELESSGRVKSIDRYGIKFWRSGI